MKTTVSISNWIPSLWVWFLFCQTLIFFFFFKCLYWSIIALQWCASFCFITKWTSYTYAHIHIFPPSCISLPPSLSDPSRWSQSTKLISLCYVAASHQLSILHLVVYISPCHSPHLFIISNRVYQVRGLTLSLPSVFSQQIEERPV